MFYSSITSKGQTTIPAELREQYDLKPGDKISYINHGDYLVVVPVNKSVAELKGILPKPAKPLSLAQIDEVIRGQYDRD